VSFAFEEESFLIPTQADVDLLLATAFQPPSVNALLDALSLTAGAFSSTTAFLETVFQPSSVDDIIDALPEITGGFFSRTAGESSPIASVQSTETVESLSESSGTTFVAGALVIFIAGIFVVTRKGDRINQSQSHTFASNHEPIYLSDQDDYGPESNAMLGRIANQPMPGQGYMGFDEAFEVDFVPSDEDERKGASYKPLFKRPFLLTPFGRSSDRIDHTQSHNFALDQEPKHLSDRDDYGPESNAILGRIASQPSPGQGYMGFDEAIEIDFVPSDDDERGGASHNALFKRPFLLTPLGGEKFGG
jgi:hypothetical protein